MFPVCVVRVTWCCMCNHSGYRCNCCVCRLRRLNLCPRGSRNKLANIVKKRTLNPNKLTYCAVCWSWLFLKAAVSCFSYRLKFSILWAYNAAELFNIPLVIHHFCTVKYTVAGSLIDLTFLCFWNGWVYSDYADALLSFENVHLVNKKSSVWFSFTVERGDWLQRTRL